MTLESFYLRLEHWKGDVMNFTIENVFSWRGIYAEPCCEISINESTKEHNIQMLDRLCNEIFERYKGGEFSYDFSNDIHFETDPSSYTPDAGYIKAFVKKYQDEPIVKYLFEEYIYENN